MRSWTAWWLCGASIAAGGSAAAAPGDYRVVRSFAAPQASPDGLAWDGEHLWVTECQSTLNYELDPETGAVLSRSTSTGIAIDHLAWDGTSMWGTHAHTTMFHRFDAAVEGSLEMVTAPTSVMGMTWDGEAMWLLDPDGKEIYRWENGRRSPTASFPTPGNNPCGLGWDGKCLWAGDLSTQEYYQMDPATGEVVLAIDAPGGPGRLPTGFAWDGEHAWIADEDPGDPALYQLEIELLPDGPCGRPSASGGTRDGTAASSAGGGCAALPAGTLGPLCCTFVLSRRRRPR